LSFALFMGVAMAVTAFPVLARILTDRGIAQTNLGVLALSCAAVDDVTAWCLLALVAGVVQSQVTSAAWVAVLSLAYIALMLLVVRPLAGWLIRKSDHHELGPTAIALIFGALLLSALATEWIGIHAVFGAFLLGVAIPHDSLIARSLKAGLEQVVLVLLLPAFFAFTGMRTQIGLVAGLENWLICGLIILVASLGKFGGCLFAARACGLDWRTSSAVGILMNTRGLMELIVLNIGYDLGVISPTLFAMMVLMALVTTLATTPLLSLLEPRCGPNDRRQEPLRQPDAEPRAAGPDRIGSLTKDSFEGPTMIDQRHGSSVGTRDPQLGRDAERPVDRGGQVGR
jgi:Kef-type K+ transport system membrane component KefB